MAAKKTKEELFIEKRMKDEEAKILAVLDEITSKEPAALTEQNIAFLRARRSYLTGDQLAKFEEVLERKDDPADELEELQTTTSTDEEVVLDAEKMTYNDLKTEAKELGIKYVGVSKDALAAAVAEAKKQ